MAPRFTGRGSVALWPGQEHCSEGRVSAPVCQLDQTFEHEGGIKGRFVPAALAYCLMEGLLCQTVQQMTGLALLEIDKKVLKPTFVGDTIHSEVEVTAIKPTSRGNRGVVTTVNNIVNQRGDMVITYKAVRMMAGRRPN